MTDPRGVQVLTPTAPSSMTDGDAQLLSSYEAVAIATMGRVVRRLCENSILRSHGQSHHRTRNPAR